MSFRRLFIEDYLMIFSLLTLIALSCLLQRFLGDIYTTLTLRNEETVLGSDFPDRLLSAIHATAVVLILTTIGIWAIKLNFLSFFRGFGRQIKSYMVFWWASFILVIACGLGQLGLLPYQCMFASLYPMVMNCATKSTSNHIFKVYEACIAIDIVSDAISKAYGVHWAT